ncbi:hypothetical protein DC31_11880 [Microbacterium sp. CH12i]|uniref:hypothetical protein n=1 Tax=Microbacterium sp. CH12i TaxID=1479651 RepID=UPI0004615EBE|nr:hypothetical protein [Microbacterium sp. CH12i]KDA06169.1 hypothetical protein DC31_11880 [Microbacterium sp. CH12i]
MQLIDTLAAVGEVLSWIGLGMGVPLLVIAGMVALAEGRWERVDIATVDRDGVAIARWFAGGDFHERALTAREAAADEWHRGFVSVRNPSHARLNPPVLKRLLLTLGLVFSVVGVIGFIVSMIPAFF